MNRRTFLKQVAAAATVLPALGVVERHLCKTLGPPKFYEPKSGDVLLPCCKADAEVTFQHYAEQVRFLGMNSPWNRELYGV